MLITLALLKLSKYNRFQVIGKTFFLKPLFAYFLKIGSKDFF